MLKVFILQVSGGGEIRPDVVSIQQYIYTGISSIRDGTSVCFLLCTLTQVRRRGKGDSPSGNRTKEGDSST